MGLIQLRRGQVITCNREATLPLRENQVHTKRLVLRGGGGDTCSIELIMKGKTDADTSRFTESVKESQ